MVFSSSIFVFFFLPIVFLIYFVAPRSVRNLILLIASLFFYAWGTAFFVGIMLVSILANYFVGLWIAKDGPNKKLALTVGVSANLLLLGTFKYTNFIVENLSHLLTAFGFEPVTIAPIPLPIGISFFTFQALSYLIDLYRGKVEPQRKLIDLALYIALFPQLIAGPIVRYADIAVQLKTRQTGIDNFGEGIHRFIIGFGKKLLIANILAVPVDNIFALSNNDLSAPIAWFGIVCFTLQVYFDFSGYSDMAIGLGRMFGFRFRENFNYPYTATSIREFWQRWHISLSSWFRDYLYIPLGGNRCPAWCNYRNLVIVFLLCGLWHGASWNFVIFGLYHGVFMVLERTRFDKLLSAAWRPVRHAYALFVVAVGLVFFRAETLPEALNYLQTMFGMTEQIAPKVLWNFANTEVIIILFIAIIGSTPWLRWLQKKSWTKFLNKESQKASFTFTVTELIVLSTVFFLAMLKVASESYNPFIYFRF